MAQQSETVGAGETMGAGEAMASSESTGPMETLDVGESAVDAAASSELKISDDEVDVRDFDMHEGGVAGSASAEALSTQSAHETAASNPPMQEQLPMEASADFKPPQGHAGEHPPPKAVVTPRKGRGRKPKEEPPA